MVKGTEKDEKFSSNFFPLKSLTDFFGSSNSHSHPREEKYERKSTEFCHHLSIKADTHPLRKKVKPSGKKRTGKKPHKRQIYARVDEKFVISR
jgi:hypothetical protein